MRSPDSPVLVLLTAAAVLVLSGCNPPPQTVSGQMVLQEFRFEGGVVAEGRLRVDSAYEVVGSGGRDEAGPIQLMAPDGGPGISVTCSCFLEGDGFCWEVVDEGIGGPGVVDINCASADCGEDVALCAMDISDGDNRFALRVACNQTVLAEP